MERGKSPERRTAGLDVYSILKPLLRPHADVCTRSREQEAILQ